MRSWLKGFSGVLFIIIDLPKNMLNTPTNIANIVAQIFSLEVIEFPILVLSLFFFAFFVLMKVSTINSEKLTSAEVRGSLF